MTVITPDLFLPLAGIDPKWRGEISWPTTLPIMSLSDHPRSGRVEHVTLCCTSFIIKSVMDLILSVDEIKMLVITYVYFVNVLFFFLYYCVFIGFYFFF